MWPTPLTIEAIPNTFIAFVSLEIVNGNPAIAYTVFQPAGNSILKYIRSFSANGDTVVSWGTGIVVDANDDAGFYPSLAVINGNPAISYNFSDPTQTFSYLGYIRALDQFGIGATGAWGNRITVDTADNFYTSLKSINGNPAISYVHKSVPSISSLRYIRSTDSFGTTGSWVNPITVDSSVVSVGDFNSLQLVNGNPAISYYDRTNGDLKYIRSNDPVGTTANSWTTPAILDSIGNVGQHTSLQVINGLPAISYYDVTNRDLKYVRATDINSVNYSYIAITN